MPSAPAVPSAKDFPPMVNWSYDLIIWSFSLLVDLFFREVHPRGAFRIPRRGAVIFVAAPHANQFVDPLILMRAVRLEARRRLAILIAEKSMRRKFIGWLSRQVGAVPVARAQDMTSPGTGRIFLADPDHQPLRIRGIGTKFTDECMPGGLLVLPPVGSRSAASSEIAEVLSDHEILLKKDFRGSTALQQLTADGGSPFKKAPKVDQTMVYDAVFHRLNSGGCVGIFPEGGSHDRTELLPLKAGVAIMALGALAANPECDLRIVPAGLNYFHAHKFRSRAVVEFGTPIEVPKELVDQYRAGEKREAVRCLLELIYNGLLAVTVTSPDYDTLMVIQAARRLYEPVHKKLPLPAVVELNRRLVTGYTHYKDDPRIINLRASVTEYNRQLRQLGLRDHQVEYAKFSMVKVISTLIYRTAKLVVLGLGALPGFILFLPVFVATKIISIRKAKEALKGSTVKIQGRDVIATWKLLVSLAFAPLCYNFYVVLACWLTARHRFFGLVPDWMPIIGVVILGWIVFPAITFAALRFGETGMDIAKSLRPLILSLYPTSANTLVRLRERRAQLADDVTNLINDLAPEIFPDFESKRIVAEAARRDGSLTTATTMAAPRITIQQRDLDFSEDGDHPVKHNIPSSESFANLANIGLFASRPVSRARSRSNSGGFPIKALSGMEGISTQASFDTVTKKIADAMKERRRKKKRTDVEGEDGEEGSDDQEEEDSDENDYKKKI